MSKAPQKNLIDCTYFMSTNSTCNKRGGCTFRHCSAAKETDKTCENWKNNACNSVDCPRRHPKLTKTKADPKQRDLGNAKENKNKTQTKTERPKKEASHVHENSPSNSTFSAMLLGETGSGKSTFINYLANYFLGGNIKKRAAGIHVAIPTKYLKATMHLDNSELDISDSTKSKTSECKSYHFDKNGAKFTFVDTPGMSDTSGVAKDDENILKILDQAEVLKNLSALVLIINGTIARVTVTVRNVLQRLKSSIPDSALQNIIILFTNCRSNLNRNFELKSLQEFCNPQKIYHMDNLAFCTDPAIWDENKQGIKHLEECWSESMDVIKEILGCVRQNKAVITEDFKKMRELKFKIKDQLTQSRTKVQELQKTYDALKQFQSDFESNSKNEKAFANYVTKTTKPVKKLVDSPYHSTLCQKCQHVCHNQCGLSEISEVGSNAFVHCAAFGGATSCKVCPEHCSYSVHYHARKVFTTEQQSVEQILGDIKAKYDTAKKGKEDAQKKISTVGDSLNMIQKALNKEREDLEANCKQLKSLCKGFNLVDELHILIDQLEIDAKALQNLDARKRADNYIANLKAFVDFLGKDSNNGTSSNNNTPKTGEVQADQSSSTSTGAQDEEEASGSQDEDESFESEAEEEAPRESGQRNRGRGGQAADRARNWRGQGNYRARGRKSDAPRARGTGRGAQRGRGHARGTQRGGQREEQADQQ